MLTNRLSLVRQRANCLYEKYELSVPIDLDIIINKKGIRVLHEENQFEIDGLCKLQNNPPQIILNTAKTYEPRRRFTIAHEIGHICIPWHTGVDLCSLDNPYFKMQGQQMINTQEVEANVFASELLMPTEWLKQTFDLKTEDLSNLVSQICGAANTSILACFYALENVLPAGELFIVKGKSMKFWKSFYSVNTQGFYVSLADAVPFYDEVCYWKNEFQLANYSVIHYKVSPAPDFSTINTVYLDCNSNFEELLSAITGGNPIAAVPYIDKIINTLDDKFYVIVKIGGAGVQHFRHDETAIRMHTDRMKDIDDLYSYIQDNFCCYGRIDLSLDSCILWVKEQWRGGNISNVQTAPEELLKIIISEIYQPKDSLHMYQRINGVMASINSSNKTASQEQLYHRARLRFETDPEYELFVGHHDFEQYISGKILSLIAKRRSLPSC